LGYLGERTQHFIVVASSLILTPLLKTKQRPSKRSILLKVFDQLCKIATRTEVDPEQVVFQLVARRVIQLVEDLNKPKKPVGKTYREDAKYVQYLTIGLTIDDD